MSVATDIKEGTCVLIRNSSDTSQPPLYGRVQEVEQGDAGEVHFRYTLYVLPEEVPGGRKKYHSQKELIKSDSIMAESSANVVGVWTLNTLK